MGIVKMENGDLEFCTGYMDKAFRDPAEILSDARHSLKGWKYDTFVGTGMSGVLVVPVLARAMHKNMFIVRKYAEQQNAHTDLAWVGRLGRRWVFVDDFISTGDTLRQVRESVRAAVWRYCNSFSRRPGDFDSTLVGTFTYAPTAEARLWTPNGEART